MGGRANYHDEQCEGSNPLVMGVARGVRSFYLDSHGWLRGVTYKYAWRDGENVAQCFVAKNVNPMLAARSRHGQHTTATSYVMGGVEFPDDPAGEIKPHEGHQWDRCDGLDPECGCGFYAYHTGTVQYATSGVGARVSAVVEAYGRLILGPLGYRAEKARIVAAVMPHTSAAGHRRQELERVRRDLAESVDNMGQRPRWYGCTLAVWYAAAGLGCLVSALIPGGPPAYASALLAGYALVNAAIIRKAAHAEWHNAMDMLESEIRQCTKTINMLPEDYQAWARKAIENYPGVRWYMTREAMLKDFPVESLAELARENTREVTDG